MCNGLGAWETGPPIGGGVVATGGFIILVGCVGMGWGVTVTGGLAIGTAVGVLVSTLVGVVAGGATETGGGVTETGGVMFPPDCFNICTAAGGTTATARTINIIIGNALRVGFTTGAISKAFREPVEEVREVGSFLEELLPESLSEDCCDALSESKLSGNQNIFKLKKYRHRRHFRDRRSPIAVLLP
jgi:hypothetical protein